MTTKPFRLIITCGGTGGHFYPGLAIACEHQANQGEVLIVLAGKNADRHAENVRACGIPVRVVSAAPLSKNPVRLFLAGLQQLRGFLQAKSILKQFRPDAVLAMGSFTGLPAVAAAVWLRIPLFLHDGNARVGKANRFFSKYAKLLMTAFPAVNAPQCACRMVTVGMPLRTALLAAPEITKQEAVAKINTLFHVSLDPGRRTLLIFGGSQGARTLNTVIAGILNGSDGDFQLIHLTGKGHLKPDMYPNHTSLCLESTDEMTLLYHAADNVICRSGGSTLAELAYFEKSSCLIPLPLVSEDHQTDNARYYVDNQAAEMISESELSPDIFLPLLNTWLTFPYTVSERAAQAKKLARPNAARDTLNLIRNTLND